MQSKLSIDKLEDLARKREEEDEIITQAFSDPRVLDILERRFQCHLPCFQGNAGSYDPLDAMKRDAQREVFLKIRFIIQNHN